MNQPIEAVEAETAVLGSVLLSDNWLDALLVDVALTSDDFYRDRHRLIFAAMTSLRAVGEPVDTLTVANHLKTTGTLEEAGGRAYVETLPERVPSIANAVKYGQIVKDSSLQRSVLLATHTIQGALDAGGEAQDIIDLAQREILNINYETASTRPVTLGEAISAELESLERSALDKRQITGAPSGFGEIDALTGGFQPGNLIVLAARPSMGKTALGGQWAINAAAKDLPTVLVSLEMNRGELVQRFLALRTGIEGSRIRRGDLGKSEWPKVLEASQELDRLPLWIDDAPQGVTVLTLRSKLRRLDTMARARHKRGLGLVVVDYLQLLRPLDPKMGRVQQVAEMSHGLKSIARELACPVVALSQLSRAVETRKPPIPILSDLRDSGDIEQDADLVAFLYREDYYRKDSIRKGVADLILAKHRNGPIGELELGFMPLTPKFLPNPLISPTPNRSFTPDEL